jgi:hypothetical protein
MIAMLALEGTAMPDAVCGARDAVLCARVQHKRCSTALCRLAQSVRRDQACNYNHRTAVAVANAAYAHAAAVDAAADAAADAGAGADVIHRVVQHACGLPLTRKNRNHHTQYLARTLHAQAVKGHDVSQTLISNHANDCTP